MDSLAQSHFMYLLTELPNEAPLQLGEYASELSLTFDKSSNRYQLRVDDIPPEIQHICSNIKEKTASEIEVEGSRVQFQPSQDGRYVYMSLKFKKPDSDVSERTLGSSDIVVSKTQSRGSEPTTVSSQPRTYHLIDLHKLSCDCFRCQHSSSQVFPQNALEIRQIRALLGQNSRDFDPPKEGSDLCQKCKEVDFHGVFDPLGKGRLEIFRRRIKKWSLQYVLSQGTCPFCLFLSGLYRRVHSGRSVHEDDCIKITLRPTADLIYDPENSKKGCLVSKAGVVLIKKDQSIRRREVLAYLLELENDQFKGMGSNAFKGRRVCPTKEARFKLIKNWLRTCEECHSYVCSAPVATLHWRNNLRMVDSHTRSVICAPVGCRYITLSYVWGGFDQVRLTSRTIKALSQPGGLDTVGPLAQTVSDAIQVCASIGEQYIWIDSLCIIQDDATDIASQIPQMGSIYSNATLTIVDAAGKDANSGLMGVTTDYASTPRQFECSVNGLNLITVEWNVAANVLEEVWSKRAWTFQEKLVSKRMLFFGRSQVWFSCCTALWREDMSLEDAPSQLVVTDRRVRFFESFFDKDISYNLSNGSIGKTRPDQLATYNLLVKEYIGKQLTKSEDILNAFSGVEEILTAPLGSFISGLPAEFLSWAVLWEMENSAEPGISRPGFPSWSWAGWIFSQGGLKMASGRLYLIIQWTVIYQNKISTIQPTYPEWQTNPKMLWHFEPETLLPDNLPSNILNASVNTPILAFATSSAVFSVDQTPTSTYTRFNEVKGQYSIKNSAGKTIGKIDMLQTWRNGQPSRLKFIVAGMVEIKDSSGRGIDVICFIIDQSTPSARLPVVVLFSLTEWLLAEPEREIIFLQ